MLYICAATSNASANSGASETERLPASSYDKATTEAVYRALRHQAGIALGAGCSVVVDAVHRHVGEREALEQVAVQLGVPFDGLWLEAAVELRTARVSKREHDASDADAAVAASQVEEAAKRHRLAAHRCGGRPRDRARQGAGRELALK